eukprot:CAMPEP_0182444980 /NCGR_PEP_ID=MMETSP1172-20130603/3263_1 /TAXON_ID=708627 /ORGANISM="Timspurckia oligopyrenoides, Strain CCMP3278" /LENGTH=480 /DNA_ID=CAMNT_0024640663 /DNA_START=372 /DNA_END=1814 /DNA_ORIENTATION=-
MGHKYTPSGADRRTAHSAYSFSTHFAVASVAAIRSRASLEEVDVASEALQYAGASLMQSEWKDFSTIQQKPVSEVKRDLRRFNYDALFEPCVSVNDAAQILERKLLETEHRTLTKDAKDTGQWVCHVLSKVGIEAGPELLMMPVYVATVNSRGFLWKERYAVAAFGDGHELQVFSGTEFNPEMGAVASGLVATGLIRFGEYLIAGTSPTLLTESESVFDSDLVQNVLMTVCFSAYTWLVSQYLGAFDRARNAFSLAAVNQNERNENESQNSSSESTYGRRAAREKIRHEFRRNQEARTEREKGKVKFSDFAKPSPTRAEAAERIRSEFYEGLRKQYYTGDGSEEGWGFWWDFDEKESFRDSDSRNSQSEKQSNQKTEWENYSEYNSKWQYQRRRRSENHESWKSRNEKRENTDTESKVVMDAYTTLGIDKNASDEDVKNAFRKKALKYHPDHHGNQFEAEFKSVSSAYTSIVTSRSTSKS